MAHGAEQQDQLQLMVWHVMRFSPNFGQHYLIARFELSQRTEGRTQLVRTEQYQGRHQTQPVDLYVIWGKSLCCFAIAGCTPVISVWISRWLIYKGGVFG
jgi:hypothetical protein